MPDPVIMSTMDSRTKIRRRIIQITSWMIPPIFALAAALVHFQFHVPHSAMLPRAKEDKKTKPRPAKKSAPSKSSPQAREQAEIDALRVQWEKQPIDDEPDDPNFRRQHESLLRSVGQLAREAALEQRPASLRITPKCHTIRCELELCGPTTVIDVLAATLPKVERKDGPLWHELREVVPTPASSNPNQDDNTPEAEQRGCRAWVVGFVVEGSKRTDLQVDGYVPAKPKPAPPKPGPGPTLPENLPAPGVRTTPTLVPK